METLRRVLFVTRRFWPTITDDTLRLAHWTQHLSRARAEVTILTSRPNKKWPATIQFGDAKVIRLDDNSSNPLRGNQFARNLTQWCAERIGSYDLVCLDGLTWEHYHLLTHMPEQQRPFTVLRYDPRVDGLSRSSKLTLSQRAEACNRVTAVLTGSDSCSSLMQEFPSQSSIVQIDDAIPMRIDRSIGARRRAREMLCDINHDLFTKSTDKVIVCPGEITTSWNIDYLLKSLGSVIARSRNLRMWITGDGPGRHRVYDSLRHEGLHHDVIMPGVFTDMEAVLQVADLCIFPAPGLGSAWLIPNCMANNIPVLVADSSDARRLAGETSSQLLFEPDSVLDLRQRVEAWNRDSGPLARAALELQRLMLARYDYARATDRFLSLSRTQSAIG